MTKSKLARAIEGSKGGDNRKAVEAPDSLFSIANARIVDLVSEGEIEGFAHGEDGMLRDVYYDETPVENADGTRNFKFLTIEARYGTQDQSYIPGFAAVENESSVGIELKAGTPWTRSISNRSLSAVRVRIGAGPLSRTNDENGDVSGTSVAYSIELSTDGGPFQVVLRSAITGKASSLYERGHRIDLPKSEVSGWSIRVRRLTPDSTTQYLQNKTYLLGITEIVDGKFRYPMSALVASEIDASQFQTIPVRAFHLKGRIIRVPANYDPETRTYATSGPGTSGGTWDGTFKTAYSNNPAWVFYDLVTHRRYGLGSLMDEHRLDKWSLYAIAQWCDQMVPDGFGGMEPRMTCNLYLQQAGDAWKVLGDLTSVFRAICYWAGGSIVPVADRPTDPVYTYHNGNVVNGDFVYSSSSRQDRHSAVLVSYNDMSDMGRLKTDYYDDPETMARFGFRSVSINAIGCTSRGQARRLARWVLLTEKLLTNSVRFSVGEDGTFAVPGQVVRIADRHRAGRRIGGRIRASGSNYVEVDSIPTPAPAPGDTLTALMEDGVTESRTIAQVTNNRIQTTSNFTSVPVVEGAWSVEMSDLSTQLFRILSTKREDDGVYTIQGLEHNPSIFAAVDSDEPIVLPPITVIPGASQPPVETVTITSVERAGQVVASTMLTAEWTPAPGAVRYRVQWQKDDGSWSPAVDVHGVTSDLEAAFAGWYKVKVEAVNALNVVSIPTYSAPFNLTDQTRVPGVIGELQDDVEQTWQELQDEVTARIEGDQQEAFNRTQAIAQEAADRAAALQTLSDELWGTIEGLQTSLNDILGAVDHDPDVAYEQDDIVKSGGSLYRAIQPVPVGTPITDTAYWLLIGEYASIGDAVAATIARVNVLTAQVTNLDGLLASTNILVTELQSGLSDAEADLQAQAALISSLSTTVSETEDTLEAISLDLAGLTAAIAGKADASALQAVEVRVTEAEDLLESVTTDITNLESALADKASVAALNALTTRVTEAEGTLTSIGNQITTINTELAGKASVQALNDLTGRVTETEDSIEALGTDLARVTARVGEMPDNLIQKPRFEDGSRGNWTSGSVVSVTGIPNATKGLSINQSTYEGAAADGFYAAPGEMIEFSAWVNTTSRTGTGSVRLALHAITNTGANAGFPEAIGGTLNNATTGWHRVSGVATMPANTFRARPLINLAGGTGNVIVADLRISRITKYQEAQTEATSLLEARVTQNEQGISAGAADITALRASVMGDLVPGRNMVSNPNMKMGTSHWNLTTHVESTQLMVNSSGTFFYFSNGLAGTGNRFAFQNIMHPDIGGNTFTWSAELYLNNSLEGQYAIDFVGLDAANNAIWIPSDDTYLTVTGAWTRLSFTKTAPAGVVGLRVRIRAIGARFSDFRFRRVKLELGSTPTEFSDDVPYTAATQTLQVLAEQLATGQTSLMARHSMTLDVNGFITGWVFNNDGTTGSFDIRADRFSISNPSGGAGTVFSNGNWRVYDSSGVMRVRMGVW